MEIGQKHLEFKSHCEKIIGKKIVSVVYTEIDYGKLENKPSEPYYHTHYENIHTIDFSIFMYTDQNDKEAFGMSDNLLITDNEELARKTKIIE